MFEALYNKIVAAAVKAAPAELCGVIYDGEFIPLTNTAPDPLKMFMFSTADTMRYMMDPKTQAVVHSHPADVGEDGALLPQLSPSLLDMQQQIATAKPWVLTCFNPNAGAWETFEWGDHTLDLPMLVRPFRSGVEDCYTLIRKWYWQKQQARLDEIPRMDHWYGDKINRIPPALNLYLDHFESQGFRRFDPPRISDLRPGDVFFWQLNSTVYNHAGVYVGDGLIYHHVHGRLSQEDAIGPWFRRIDFWARRE